MTPARRAALLALLAGCGCASAAEDRGTVRVAHRPPDRTDILEAVILSEGASLAGDPDCAWAADAEGHTVGRYFGGLLAGPYASGPFEPGAKWIEVTTVPQSAPEGALWRSTVIIHAGEPNARGLEFLIRQADGAVLADTFRCVRAGS